MAAVYPINPRPQSGSGVFGAVPGPISLPQPFQAFGKALPNTPAIAGGASSDIVNELSGQLSPDTLATIQNNGAAWGVDEGIPGSGLQQNYDLNAAAQASMAQQQQGQKNYQATVGPTSRYLTVAPSTEAELAQINAINAASPNPTQAGLVNIGSHIAGLGFGYALNDLTGGSGGSSVSYSDFPTNPSTDMNFDPNAGGAAEGVTVPG
jgi:hypothetical protein